MIWKVRLPALLLGLGLLAGLSACGNLPVDLGPGSGSERISLVEISPSVAEWDACSGEGITIRARVNLAGAELDHARLEYRAVADSEGAWQPGRMVQVSQEQGSVALELDLERFWPEESSPSSLQFAVVAADSSGQETRWPATEGEYSAVSILPCDPDQDVQASGTELPYELVDYGVSSSEAGYGPGCEPKTVTFEIVLQGWSSVDSVWVNTTWMGNQGVAETIERPMADMGFVTEPEGARRYTFDLNIESEAPTNLGNESGQLGWNIYVRMTDNQVMEYPVGGPPIVAVQSCVNDDVGANPTSTLGPIIAIPLITPTPTQGIVLIPILPYQSLGQEDNMQELNFFDLDSGTLYGSFNGQIDFQLHPGDDPYLDNIRPMNGSYFGWYGEDQPTKTHCENTLKATSSTTINWPDMEDTFFCYETSDGRTGWLRVDLWVSLPLAERRFGFGWGTYK